MCADEKQKFDELVEDQGVRILIEPTAIMHVLGTKMDFVEDRLKCALSPDAPCLVKFTVSVFCSIQDTKTLAWHAEVPWFRIPACSLSVLCCGRMRTAWLVDATSM